MTAVVPPLSPRIGAGRGLLRPGARRRRALAAAGRPAALLLVVVGYRRRGWRRGCLPPSPCQVALQLVRVLVSAERLRAAELPGAVAAGEDRLEPGRRRRRRVQREAELQPLVLPFRRRRLHAARYTGGEEPVRHPPVHWGCVRRLAWWG